MRTGLAIDHDHLGGEAEARVDGRVGDVRVAELLRPVDEVLALVVDARRAAAGQRRRARLAHRAGRHQRAARAGRLAEAELARGVDDHVDAFGSIASSSAATCRATVCTPWPISVQPWRTSTRPGLVVGVGMEVDDRLRHLAEPVAESGVLEPEPEADRLAVGDRRVVGALDLVEARLGAAGPVVHDLTGSPLVAGADHVALADLPAADADLLGQPIEHAFERELRLVRTEPAERAAHQVVRAHGDRLDVERVPPVGAAGVAGGAFEHLHPDAGVRARVADAADLERA